MDYRRVKQPGGCYFFTVVTERRQPLLIHHIARLRNAFRHVQAQHPFHVDAIVILPDHIHCIWTLPPHDANYSMRWNLIKRHFSIGLPHGAIRPSRRRRREKGVWQRRFWEHCIRNEQDWSRHMDYIHFNPVKHGYVDAVGAWPYSSFRRLAKAGWYPEDWGRCEPESISNMDLE